MLGFASMFIVCYTVNVCQIMSNSRFHWYHVSNSFTSQGSSQDINLDFVRLPFQFSSGGGHQNSPSQTGASSGAQSYFSQYPNVRPSFPDDTKKNVMDSARQTLFVEKLLPYVKQYAYTWFHLQVGTISAMVLLSVQFAYLTIIRLRMQIGWLIIQLLFTFERGTPLNSHLITNLLVQS